MVGEEQDAAPRRRVIDVVSRYLPIIRWLRNYTKENAVSDLIAGVTLGLTMIPQSIAYASLAGLTPQDLAQDVLQKMLTESGKPSCAVRVDLLGGILLNSWIDFKVSMYIPQFFCWRNSQSDVSDLLLQDGLNSSFIGGLIYTFFGTIKEVIIGPTSLMALLTYQYTSELNIDFVVLLCFLCGVVEIIMGLLHLGFLVELISAPVVSGFTTATSLIIIVSQMKGLLGLKFKSDGIIDNIRKLFQNAHHIRVSDTILGVACIVFLLCLRKLKEVRVGERMPCRSVIKKVFWVLSTGRNALAVFITAFAAYHYKSSGSSVPFLTTRATESNMPSIRLPPTSTTLGNKTYNFQEMVAELGSGYLVIPVISVLANVAIAKAFVNGAVDATQEMLTLSLCNMVGSLVQSMPVTGAFTRSAVASASGIRTPIAGLYAAMLALMALGFLGPYFQYIPRATLSAILIAAVIFLIDWQIVGHLWKTSWLDLFTVALTLVISMVVGVEVGLLIGAVVGLMYLIYKWARPDIYVQTTTGPEERTVTVKPSGGFYFPAVDYISEAVQKAALTEGRGRDTVQVDCSSFVGTDYTVAKGINSLKTAFAKRGQPLQFVNVPRTCYKLWTGSGCKKEIFVAMENGSSKFGENIKMNILKTETKKDGEGDDLLKTLNNDHIG